MDFVAKPSSKASIELRKIEKDLLLKVKGAKGVNLESLNRARQIHGESSKRDMRYVRGEAEIQMVAIGASTGGPPALQVVLAELPKNFPSAIAISQHMPQGFTGSLADRLNKLCSLRVKEAEQDDIMEEGKVLICPGGYHMSFRRRGGKVRVGLKEAVYEDMYVPSVDVMMRSAADIYGNSTMGVILTGMGNDGTDGMKKISSNGGINIAESEETAVVFGMPAGAIKAGVAHRVLPLDKIAREIIKTVKAKK